jgi:phosphatidylserine/phosphatidylglycerophosphate/cardiolipin synthase-like enzyme
VQLTESDVSQVIDRNLALFDKPGVLSMRPGLKVKNNLFKNKLAIVVMVHQKLSSPPKEMRLPKLVEGVPVDVRQATTAKREQILNPAAYAMRLRFTPDVGAAPYFADERTPSGARPALIAAGQAQPASRAKEHLTYTPPPGVQLQSVDEEVTIEASASPDSGWFTLRPFLARTKASLVVAMYQFGADYIEEEVAQALNGKKLKLVLDYPSPEPGSDETNGQTVAELSELLGSKFVHAWALTQDDPQTTAWIYRTSYHIKVAVRDRSVFWLSSGNWNNFSLPDLKSRWPRQSREKARECARDWHVVIESRKLARVFESYILNDLKIAGAHNVKTPPLPSGAPPPLPPTQTNHFKRFFRPEEFTERTRITPVLTPDDGVYIGAVKELIKSAEQKLCLQYQYIYLSKTPEDTPRPFLDLVDMVIARQKVLDDVRIILSEWEEVHWQEWFEPLLKRGLDPSGVRIQPNVHNKGILVDAKTVLVSSQNWSPDGTLFNRDAGVIIESEAVAGYFQKIFEHDWANLARPVAG